jgi:hypothetical protein
MKTSSAWHRSGIAALAAVSAFGVGALLRTPPGSSESPDEVVSPVLRAPRAASAATNSAATPAPTASRLEPEVAFNPFGPLNFGTPAALGQPSAPPEPPKKAKQAPPPPPPPPLPAPTAPPLPFVALGSLAGADVTGGQTLAFLQQQDQLLVVRAGDAVGNTYRVNSITPQRIEFTYLPLNQRQFLPLSP